jgi:hypothetical protein
MPYNWNLGLWPDDGQYGPMELKGSKLGFLSSFNINKKFQIDRVPSCPTFEIWDLGRMMASMGQWSSELKIGIFEFIRHQ